MTIEIREISPIKLSGRTSFQVSFPFNQKIIDAIKTVPNSIWHKATKTWEVGANSLSKLLDTLTFLGNISLRLLPTEITEISAELTDKEISEFKTKLFDHQIKGVNFLLTHPKSLLLDAPGCGKTLTAMSYAEVLHKRKEIDHCLVIVGFSSLKQNWKKEIQKFSNESVIVIGEKISKKGIISYTTLAERAEQLKNPISEFFVIINIETLRDEKAISAILTSKNNFDLIVVDEIHKCSGSGSEQFAGLKKLKAKYKVGLTGTLITNNPLSAAGPLMWTENDHATLTNYKAQYCTFGETAFTKYQITGYKNLDLLKDELDSCSLRRTFDMISDNMPEKIIEVEYVEMDDKHHKFYEEVKNGVKDDIDKVNLNSSNLLALTTRLRQASSAPGVLSSNSPDSSKILRCVDLVKELIEQNEKVVILANFKESVYDLARKLENYSPLISTGDQTEDQISKNIDKFQNDSKYKIFIGTHSRIGTGVTLNSAKHLICIDTPWTWASFDQSACRIYRINNKNSAIIKVLCAVDTIDERIWNILETKKDLSDYLIDGKENSVSSSLQNEMKNILWDL